MRNHRSRHSWLVVLTDMQGQAVVLSKWGDKRRRDIDDGNTCGDTVCVSLVHDVVRGTEFIENTRLRFLVLSHTVLRFTGDKNASECRSLCDPVGWRWERECRFFGDANNKVQFLSLAIRERVLNVQAEGDY